MSGHSVLASDGLMQPEYCSVALMNCSLCLHEWPCTAADGKKVKQKAHKKKKREIDKPAASPVTASAHPGELSSAMHICTCSVTAFGMLGILSERWPVWRFCWRLPCTISYEACIISF